MTGSSGDAWPSIDAEIDAATVRLGDARRRYLAARNRLWAVYGGRAVTLVCLAPPAALVAAVFPDVGVWLVVLFAAVAATAVGAWLIPTGRLVQRLVAAQDEVADRFWERDEVLYRRKKQQDVADGTSLTVRYSSD